MKVYAHTWSITMKLHFVCRHSNSRMERYTNAELADMHLVYGVANCNARVVQRLHAQRAPGRKFPVTPLHACTRDYLTEDSSSWIRRNNSKE
ncbi:hypothetical protein TNCV_1113651 [Trichonephila clavipes]|nr:hypothetical protein TNCV_1113651 [Trichonephila clavipes]